MSLLSNFSHLTIKGTTIQKKRSFELLSIVKNTPLALIMEKYFMKETCGKVNHLSTTAG